MGEEMGLTRALAEFVSVLQYEKLPLDVITESKLCILDWFGVVLSGSKEPLIDILLKVIKEEGGNHVASVVGRTEQLSLQQAALVNGTASHVLDYDDVHMSMMGHPSGAIFSATLALGESKKCSGRDLITAFVAGFETACHIGRSQTRKHVAHGWHPTATIGHFGAAAACANLLHLDVEQSVTAFGIAGTQAAGLRRSFGTMCKALHAGKASMNGLFAAQLAEKGFDSAKDIIEGKEGFTYAFTPDGDVAYEPKELGKCYEILDVMFKRYASCFGTHPTIDAALAMRENGLIPEDIESVHIIPYHGLYDSISIMKPKTPLEGKFSVPYTFAVAFIKGKVGEDEFTEENINSAEIVRIRDKVTMEKKESMPQNNSLVTAKTRDGRIFEMHIDINQTFKDSKKKKESLRRKYFDCAAKVLSAEEANNLYLKIMKLENVTDVGEIVTLCRGKDYSKRFK